MILLTSTSDIITVITGSAGTIQVHASYVDNLNGVGTPDRKNQADISTAATTTIVTSPASGAQRNIKYFSVYNSHASTANLITVNHSDGTTVRILWKGTLASGEMVVCDEAGVWHNFNASGVERVAAANPLFLTNYSTATVSAGYSSDTQLAGSSIALPSGLSFAGVKVRWIFDMVKTAAGTAAAVINIRFGTANTTADASVCAFTFGAGTAAADTGKFVVEAHFRTVGSGTSAVVAGLASCHHALAATGLISSGASGFDQVATVGSGFNSTVASSYISLSFNGGASFSGTNTVVETEVFNYRG